LPGRCDRCAAIAPVHKEEGSIKSVEAARRGFPNTLFEVVLRKDDRVVGMGLLVGDAGLFYQAVDIAVEPEHQGRGSGKAIVAQLAEHVRTTALVSAYISLLSDGDAKHLYERSGFKETAPASVGMTFKAT
jgi:GNAT superfamily N-acetyltransferase